MVRSIAEGPTLVMEAINTEPNTLAIGLVAPRSSQTGYSVERFRRETDAHVS